VLTTTTRVCAFWPQLRTWDVDLGSAPYLNDKPEGAGPEGDPAVNITREDFGGMASFADSEVDKIPGAMMDDNVIIIETVHCWTPLLIISKDVADAKAAPKVSDITPIINKLNKLGNAWCCQKEADNGTKLGSYGEARPDICEVNEKPKPSQQACLRCNDAGSKVWKTQWLCEDIYTNTALGYVRYVCSGRSWMR
jgi:hypothetical protein